MLVTGSGAGSKARKARKAHPCSPVCTEGAVMGGGGSAQGMGTGFNQYFLCPFVFPFSYPLLFFPPL